MLTHYELTMIDGLKDTVPLTAMDKLWDHLHRLVRRGHCSDATLRSVRSLSMRKMVQLYILGYRMLNPAEWKMFQQRLFELSDRRLKLVQCYLKVPFGHMRALQLDAISALRDTL